MNAKKYTLIILLIKILGLGFTSNTYGALLSLELKNGDVIAIKGNKKIVFVMLTIAILA